MQKGKRLAPEKTPSPERVAEAQHVVACAARWSSNMLAEAVSNHGRCLSTEQREALKAATMALSRFQLAKLPDSFDPEAP